MRHHDRRSAPGCQEKRPDRGIRRRSGPLERRKPLRSPPVASPGTPPSAIVHTVPEFIWEMSVIVSLAGFPTFLRQIGLVSQVLEFFLVETH